MIPNVAIIGLGLIGGSLGLALKRNPGLQVTGYDRSFSTLEQAFRRGIIDRIATSVENACEHADVIIFATPVNTTVKMMHQAVDWNLKEDVIMTDTGSTKGPIMDAARRLLERGITFIGGHPMAGSHKSGVTAAKEHLFENAYYILTPDSQTDSSKVEQLRVLLGPTKGKIVVLDSEEHDRMTAIVSHFPHLVASSLVGRLSAQQEEQPFVNKLAAGGFRDLTRIASADPIMWRDITTQNREELLKQLDGWLEEMENVRNMLKSNDPDEIYDYFAGAKQFRDDLPITSQGAFYMTFDLHIDIPDHPGIISEITKILADERISLTNIRIVETRTDVFGILVISFQSTDDREQAKSALSRTMNFSMYIV
ncbi:prephenate dehydrogenase [Sporosarcina sp. ANT_H38]|uniref:prephenate dehydrogenase n=1 Tax=Sporosarcina sp. ANT_H38 TaxID=2597358 RepID=UPI0011F2F765|nr:prephenate dehydrogenase [Sporosarcina sp. ANT_H38]KAA0966131.1 prephenate dehydrogenase [Sporosarcina sp. ANT_H38]